MIENLSGLHETVNYRKDTQVRLYNNNEYEDYPPHWHTPFEIIMPTDGDYRAICIDDEYHLNRNDILVICPGTMHELFAPPVGTRIIFQPSIAPLAMQELDTLTAMISPALLITDETHPAIHERVRDLMLKIRDDYMEGTPYFESSIYSSFLEMLVLIGRDISENAQKNIEATENKQKEYLDKIKAACSYINAHFSEDLTLEDAAAVAGFSKYHFTRLFRQVTNTSFYKYLSQKRIAYAKELLISERYTIMEVAYLSGFSSHASFTRMFRQIAGSTPNEFRKMYRATDRNEGRQQREIRPAHTAAGSAD